MEYLLIYAYFTTLLGAVLIVSLLCCAIFFAVKFLILQIVSLTTFGARFIDYMENREQYKSWKERNK